jgi:hypothetical protein
MALGLPLGNTHRVSRRTSSPELGGRNVELSMLQAALDDVGAGRGRLVGVERDAGVGKTRLVEYFTGHAVGARAPSAAAALPRTCRRSVFTSATRSDGTSGCPPRICSGGRVGEVKGRTKVSGRFPGETSCVSLCWAVMDIVIAATEALRSLTSNSSTSVRWAPPGAHS